VYESGDAARRLVEESGPVAVATSNRAALTIGQLTEFGELHCSIVAGAGGTQRAITWAHSSELVDPTPWLGGGELLMTTGLAIPAAPQAQVAYLERLSACGVAGLAIGDRRLLENLDLTDISDEFYAAADDLQLPIMLVSGRTPFIAIAQRVAAANRDLIHARMARHLRVYETLGQVARSAVRLPECVSRLADVSGYELSVLSPMGRSLYDDVPLPSVAVPLAAIEKALAAEDFGRRVPEPVLDGEGERRVFAIPVLADRRPVGVLVAVAGDEVDGDRLILHHIATIVSLFAAELLRERERERREGGEVLTRVLLEAQRGEPRAMRDLLPGIDGGQFAFAAIDLDTAAEGWNDVHHRLSEEGFRHVVTRRANRGVVVVALGGRDVDELAHLLSKALPASTIGLSSAVDGRDDLLVARREARWAVRSATAERVAVQHFGRATEPRWLMLETSGLELMVEAVLGRLIEHDRRTGSNLEHTLDVFLECNRSWKVAAARLFVHRQTLIHRVKRIEQLTGRRLDKTEEVCDLWLAMNARRSLSATDAGDA
jgi:purine catabolism regulator